MTAKTRTRLCADYVDYPLAIAMLALAFGCAADPNPARTENNTAVVEPIPAALRRAIAEANASGCKVLLMFFSTACVHSWELQQSMEEPQMSELLQGFVQLRVVYDDARKQVETGEAGRAKLVESFNPRFVTPVMIVFDPATQRVTRELVGFRSQAELRDFLSPR